MCGSAHLAAAVAECGLAAEGWDYIDGAAADLEVPAVIEGFRQRIRQRRLCGLHFGLDWKTWSRARNNDGLGPPPLRSDQHLFGLPALAPADQRKIDSASVIFRNILSLVEEAVAANLFVLIENPASSRLWMTPQLLDLANAYKAKFHRVDYCQYNVLWRKATIFLTFNLPELDNVLLTCSGTQARCNASGKKHITLRGKDSQGNF
ncbi:unnamed protein product [Prorocentrum cordatum]|uniref:Uncharacterized protein n=1 Tax=Prorocentrum cordatum TaxID=2364126 RepID=A0ABN9RLN2_9DINO|nr:unnamed protein product [Polarella glacialis]